MEKEETEEEVLGKPGSKKKEGDSINQNLLQRSIALFQKRSVVAEVTNIASAPFVTFSLSRRLPCFLRNLLDEENDFTFRYRALPSVEGHFWSMRMILVYEIVPSIFTVKTQGAQVAAPMRPATAARFSMQPSAESARQSNGQNWKRVTRESGERVYPAHL